MKLDSISDRFDRFVTCIDEELWNLSSKGLALYEPHIYGSPVSGTLSEEKLDRSRFHINYLQQESRYGTAYFLKLHHLRKFPSQFTRGDREQLEDIASGFTELLKDNISSHPDALEPFWSTFVQSPLLPHSFLNKNCATDNGQHQTRSLAQFSCNENKTDCLGRSISHIIHDHGSEAIKATWRSEDLHHVDILGRTAMFFACHEKNLELVGELLNAGADYHSSNITGMSPLHVAATFGSTPICRRIWKTEVGGRPLHSIQKIEDCAGRTPMMCAARAGHYDTVEFFCKEVLTSNDSNQFAQALKLAVCGGYLDIVKLLLNYRHDFDLREKDDDGHDAIWHAKRIKHSEILTELSSALNIDYNKKGDHGRTELAEAARLGNTQWVETLLSLNSGNDLWKSTTEWIVDPNAHDDDDKSPLTLAIEAGNTNCVQLFLEPRFIKAIKLQDLDNARRIAELEGHVELLHTIEQGMHCSARTHIQQSLRLNHKSKSLKSSPSIPQEAVPPTRIHAGFVYDA
ncbi:Ankyrin repeat domain-containing protein 16 [Kalmusia sp. IMI 367209]|nr:Ankyrin repeat domain-containing protein 16 [Kalmusia sp. IMI 367209]